METRAPAIERHDAAIDQSPVQSGPGWRRRMAEGVAAGGISAAAVEALKVVILL